MVATSAMDQHNQRVGRPYGGTAIVWHSSIKGKVEKTGCDNNRLCAALYTKDNMTMLLGMCICPVTIIVIMVTLLIYLMMFHLYFIDIKISSSLVAI